mgnify:FL=1|tara:strand:+ start:1171 stop:1347 length:177 start_codon:yes stop_codon:yes gene_type:complete
MLLEDVAILIQNQIDGLARRVAELEINAHQPVDWKGLIANMEERVRRLEAEIDSPKET